MKYFLGIIMLVLMGLNSSTTNAQMVIDNTLTAQQLVQDVLLGPGVVVSNITFSGSANQIGYFNATNSSFPIPEGIVMSTGDVNEVPGPGTFFASSDEEGGGDADLTDISGFNTNDAAILQFQFVPTGDSINFTFAFGSEEYPQFVNSINDAFAFIISGPGFNGPYSNNGENIALIPGTSLPVTIDNVNDVIPANAQYYVNNENGPNNGIVFNGYTVTIQARAQVICGETYTLRFAIADASDHFYDSGVFLEARSFQSNAVNVNIATASGSIEDGGGWIVEGCTGADITFERPIADVDSFLSVPVYISGSAINGIDFTGVPDTVHFVPGDTSLTFTILGLDDVLTEVGDSIVLTVYSLNLCGDTTISTGTIYIYDSGFYTYSTQASADVTVECAGDSVLLTAVASMGNPAYTYTWNNGFVGDSLWVQPTGDSLLIVNTTDACSTIALADTVMVQYSVSPNPVVNISGPSTFNCVPQSITLTAAGSSGNGPYVYLWNTGSGSPSINPVLTTDTLFYVTAFDQCGVASLPDTAFISQNPVAIPNLQTSADVVLDCPGDVATLTAIASGGVQPYQYTWSSAQTTSTISVQPSQTTDYVITITDDCYVGEVTDTIRVTVEPYTVPNVTVSDTTVLCPEDLVILNAIIDGGNDPFNISWSNGASGSVNSFNPASTTVVTVTVQDDCGNSATADATVSVPVYNPLTATILNSDLLLSDTVTVCELWSDTLASAVSGGLAPYSYNWSGTLIESSLTNDSAVVSVPYELSPDSTIFGAYILSVIDQCMTEATDTVVVQAISCDIIQPSIFNPNSTFVGATDICGNAPQNNVFNLPCLELYPGNTMTIWDRWGRKCYKTDEYHLNPWDGGNKSEGTYFYVCELPNGKEAVKGYFQIVR